jgi:hypothetical protein
MIAHLKWLLGLLQFNTGRECRISDSITIPELSASKKLAMLAARYGGC